MSFSVEAINNLGLSAAEQAVDGKKQSLGQEEFLKLMTTQLMHQDPSKPMENGDFLAQMAQFSTVEGIGALKTAFTDFAGSMTSKQALEASALVGRSVAFPSDTGILEIDKPLRGNIQLDSAAHLVNVNIKNAQGVAVKTLQLQNQPAGMSKFEWDGLLDDGSYAQPGIYTVSAEASIGGENTGLETLMSATVESVDLGDAKQGISLNLKQLGNIKFSQVKQVF